MHKERLETLVEHLERGELGHKRFDFSQYNDAESPTCGTSGCALGECPIIWPDDWRFNLVGHPVLVDLFCPEESTKDWFEIDSQELLHLFWSRAQNPEKYGGKVLGKDATRYEVAANIRAFIERKETLESHSAT